MRPKISSATFCSDLLHWDSNTLVLEEHDFIIDLNEVAFPKYSWKTEHENWEVRKVISRFGVGYVANRFIVEVEI